MKPATKLKYLNHTKERFLERFGKVLTDEQHEALCKLCRTKGTEVQNREKATKHVKRILVYLKTSPIVCAYDKKNDLIRTVFLDYKYIKQAKKLKKRKPTVKSTLTEIGSRGGNGN